MFFSEQTVIILLFFTLQSCSLPETNSNKIRKNKFSRLPADDTRKTGNSIRVCLKKGDEILKVPDEYKKIIAGIVCKRNDWIKSELKNKKIENINIPVNNYKRHDLPKYMTLAEYAAFNSSMIMLAFFIDNWMVDVYDENVLHWAVKSKKTDTVKFFIKRGLKAVLLKVLNI